MTLLEWLPAVSTTAIFAGILWLCRQLLSTRLKQSVEHEFNSKLERLRAELRAGEERLKANLDAKEAELAALRSGAMSALTQRQVALNDRRLVAVDQLWMAVTALSGGKFLAIMMSAIDLKATARLSKENANFRAAVTAMGKNYDAEAMKLTDAAKARPFVTLEAWATYSALSAIVMQGVMRWQVLTSGISDFDFGSKEGVEKLVRTALPEKATLLLRPGSEAHQMLLDELEGKLLRELQNMLLGMNSTKETLEQSAEILKQSQNLLAHATDAAIQSQQLANRS